MTAGPLLLCSERCAPLDPLQLFAAAGRAPRFYWEQPSAGRFVVAAGCARRIQAAGSQRFTDTQQAAARLFGELAWQGDGPPLATLVGGFAFAAGSGNGSWRDFGDGELWLPELCCSGEGSTALRVFRPQCELAGLQPRALAFGQPVHGAAEFVDGSSRSYLGLVEEALNEVHAGRLSKVVVARSARAYATSAIDAVAWLVALRSRFPGCTLFAIGLGESVFLGASPERLVRVSGAQVETAAIAGTAPRGASQATDRKLGQALLDNAKAREEQAIVTRFLRDALTECCDEVEAEAEPRLLLTRNVQHLCTRLRARRRSPQPVSLLELVSRLHPTPAVGGLPRDAALGWLAEHEQAGRGWFAGPVGFMQSDGDGEFAVALRSALVRGREATAWAGAGIVAGSVAAEELTETELKLRSVIAPLLWGAP